MYAVAKDSESKEYFKNLQESNYHLFKSGCVQVVIVTQSYNTFLPTSTCYPSDVERVVSTNSCWGFNRHHPK